ncbi:MAG: hypothetical protein U0271_22620 [Polyangiaceae bacterium]
MAVTHLARALLALVAAIPFFAAACDDGEVDCRDSADCSTCCDERFSEGALEFRARAGCPCVSLGFCASECASDDVCDSDPSTWSTTCSNCIEDFDGANCTAAGEAPALDCSSDTELRCYDWQRCTASCG